MGIKHHKGQGGVETTFWTILFLQTSGESLNECYRSLPSANPFNIINYVYVQ